MGMELGVYDDKIQICMMVVLLKEMVVGGYLERLVDDAFIFNITDLRC